MTARWIVWATIAAPMFALADDTITVHLRDVAYGIYATRQDAETGTYIGKRFRSFTTVNQISDRVPVKRGSAFGVQMRIDADKGVLLQLAVVLRHPPLKRESSPPPTIDTLAVYRGTRASSAWFESYSSAETTSWIQLARNHAKFRTAYTLEFPWEMVPGTWTMEIVLIGVDETVVSTAAELHNLKGGLLLYRKPFILYPPVE